jgi:hypothetical protein
MADSGAAGEPVPSVRRLVIVGGSLGAARVTEEARGLGYAGAIAVIAAEPHPPIELLGAGGVTDPFLAQYRYDAQLVGAFAFDQAKPLAKLRRAIGKRASWQQMLRDPAR